MARLPGSRNRGRKPRAQPSRLSNLIAKLVKEALERNARAVNEGRCP
jgi:hypothetical protein